MFLIPPQLDILYKNVVKRYYAKNDNNFHMLPVIPRIGVYGTKITCHRVVWTLIRLISDSGELCNKNHIVKTSAILII